MSNGQHRGGRARSSAELRSQIESTRARLASDIDAARAKLSRRGLEREAMDALRGVRSEAGGTLDSWSDATDRQVSQLGRLAVDAVKRYPLITTALGLGLALLAFNGGRRSNSAEGADDEADLPVVRPAARADLPPPAG